MIPATLIVVLVTTGALLAATLRLPSLVSLLLACYLAVVTEITGLTWALSPLHLVTRSGLGGAEAIVLVVAAALWLARGRPSLPVGRLRPAAAAILSDRLLAAFLVCVVGALAYELALGLVVAPNNWDSLTYHLTRAIAWAHHGGIYWIPNAPTDRMNEFQPGAEQQLLYLFVITGKGALYALPQFTAQLAILAGVFGVSRRLGFEVRSAAFAALFFACLAVVALESTTSQNDLVAASFPIVATALLLGGEPAEIALAGLAVGVGLGVKLTTALVLPIVALIAVRLGWRRFALFAASSGCAFAAVAMWGFVLNLVKTDHLLGHGGGRVEDTASPSFPGSISTFVRVVHQLFDLSGYGQFVFYVVSVCAVVVPVAALLTRHKVAPRHSILASSTRLLIPLLAPLLAVAGALAVQGVGAVAHLPVNDPTTTAGHFSWHINSASNEDLSGFGPLGGLAILGVSVWSLATGLRRRAATRSLALGLALPLFVAFYALTWKYDPWVSRFLIVPATLTAPLFGLMYRSRPFAIGAVVVAVAGLGLALSHDALKPLVHTAFRPWQLTQVRAVRLNWGWGQGGADTLERINAVVPARGCLGAVLGEDEPAFLLYGPGQRRSVIFLPRRGAPVAAADEKLGYVVIGTPTNSRAIASAFETHGWSLRALPLLASGRRWMLGVRKTGAAATCGA